MPSDSAGSLIRVAGLERRARPVVDRRPERRHRGERTRSPRRGRPSSFAESESTEVGGLHRAGPPPVATTNRRPEQRGRAARPRRTPGSPRRARVGAHHPHEPPASDPLGERMVDGVVVQSMREGVVLVGASLRPGVGAARRASGGRRDRRTARPACRAATGRRRPAGRRCGQHQRAGVLHPRRPRPARSRSRGRWPRRAGAGRALSPRSVRSSRRTRQPRRSSSRQQPAGRSKSARVSTWMTRPRVRLTWPAGRRRPPTRPATSGARPLVAPVRGGSSPRRGSVPPRPGRAAPARPES